jgi:hypothetical protein
LPPSPPAAKRRSLSCGVSPIVSNILPSTDAAEVLVLLEPVLDHLRHQAALALERAPTSS